MAGEWREEFRRELDSIQYEDDGATDLNVDAYLRLVGKELNATLGDSTVRFLLETEPFPGSDETFENRLIETMRIAGRIRQFTLEARSLLKGRVGFGSAFRKMVEPSIHGTSISDQELERFERAGTPQNLGVKKLTDMTKLGKLDFLRVFCLAACALEQDYVSKRDSLAAEGLARTDRSLTKMQKQKQSIDVASAVLKPRRDEAMAFLSALVTAAKEEAIL